MIVTLFASLFDSHLVPDGFNVYIGNREHIPDIPRCHYVMKFESDKDPSEIAYDFKRQNNLAGAMTEIVGESVTIFCDSAEIGELEESVRNYFRGLRSEKKEEKKLSILRYVNSRIKKIGEKYLQQ